jgi:hypothetical protein
VKTRPDADYGSDYKLLTATIRIKLKRTQVKKGWKLDIVNIPEGYKNEIEQSGGTYMSISLLFSPQFHNIALLPRSEHPSLN